MLFLVFDIELVLLLPVSVSLSAIHTYGFSIAIIFFLILTVGFIFEIANDSISIRPSAPKSTKSIKTESQVLTSQSRSLTKLNIDQIEEWLCLITFIISTILIFLPIFLPSLVLTENSVEGYWLEVNNYYLFINNASDFSIFKKCLPILTLKPLIKTPKTPKTPQKSKTIKINKNLLNNLLKRLYSTNISGLNINIENIANNVSAKLTKPSNLLNSSSPLCTPLVRVESEYAEYISQTLKAKEKIFYVKS
jgi:hypothetical protein